MKPFYMWVLLDKDGNVKRDPEGYMIFDTREQAKRYQGYLLRPKEWTVKKVKVSE